MSPREHQLVPFETLAIDELDALDAVAPRNNLFDRVVADDMRAEGCSNDLIVGLIGYLPTPLALGDVEAHVPAAATE